MTRALRMKEHLARTVRPSEAQIAVSNHTLEDKEYQISVDENFFLVSRFNSLNKEFPKVVFLGDSVIEGTYAGEGFRITDCLNKWAVEDVEKYEYLNAAYSGSTTLHCMINFIGKVMPINPKHVFLFLGGIDFSAVSYEDNFWIEKKGTTPFIAPPQAGPFKKSQRVYKYREALIVGMRSMCASLNTDFHIIIPPISPKAPWHEKIKNFDASIKARQEINDETRRIANKHRIRVLDLDQCNKIADFWYDVAHFNSKGCQFFANKIREYIQTYDEKSTDNEKI